MRTPPRGHQASRRVLLLNTAVHTGGMQRAAVSITRELRGRGWDVRLVFPETPRTPAVLQWVQAQGVDAMASRALQPLEAPHSLRAVAALRRFVSESQADIVHLYNGGNFLSLKDVIAVRSARGRPLCLASTHASDAWPASSARKRRVTRLASQLCHGIVVHSAAARDVLLSAGVPASRITLIHYGVYPPARYPTREAARAQLGISQHAFVVTTNQRLVPWKGAADLVEAVSQLPDPRGELLLLIAGEGLERENLERLAAERAARVVFLGHVHDHADLYAASDVFAMPSHDARESFGIVFVEAAFHGVPGIGTRVGGIPEAILDGETGLIVPPRQPLELARAIQELWTNDQRRQTLGEAARARAASEFTAPVMATRYQQLYSRWLTEPH